MIPVEEGRRLLAEAQAVDRMEPYFWKKLYAVQEWVLVHGDALLDAAERAEDAEANLEGVRLALAEADVPRSNGVDEPLYSEQYRVRLLRERADQLAEELRIREQSQIPVIPKAAQARLEAAEAALAEAAEQNQRYKDALERIERMAGAAGAGETPAMPIAQIARAALAGDAE